MSIWAKLFGGETSKTTVLDDPNLKAEFKKHWLQGRAVVVHVANQRNLNMSTENQIASVFSYVSAHMGPRYGLSESDLQTLLKDYWESGGL